MFALVQGYLLAFGIKGSSVRLPAAFFHLPLSFSSFFDFSRARATFRDRLVQSHLFMHRLLLIPFHSVLRVKQIHNLLLGHVHILLPFLSDSSKSP
jgi:hypothetical protein